MRNFTIPRRSRLALLFVGLAVFGGLAYKSVRVAQSAFDLKSSASRLVAYASVDFESLDIDTLAADVQGSKKDALKLQIEMRPFFAISNRLGWLPWVGPLLKSADPVIEYAVQITTAADEVLTGFLPLLQSPESSDSIPEKSAASFQFAVCKPASQRPPHLSTYIPIVWGAAL